MNTVLKLMLAILSIAGLASCHNTIEYPPGGYPYPANLIQVDSNQFCYPRDLHANRKDSFRSSYYGFYWNKKFNEPNLSIRPQQVVTFRLTYETAFNGTTIFTLTPDEITVKQQVSGRTYPLNDTMKLDSAERKHFNILENHFPVDSLLNDYPRKHAIDSVVKLFPRLRDPQYYKYLLDKSFIPDSIPFKYTVKRIPISKRKFEELVQGINASGYWKLPFHIVCDQEALDGNGFGLEANLPTRYNFVSISQCPEKASAFSWACQAIVDACNLEQKIRLVSKKNAEENKLNVLHDVPISRVKDSIKKR